MDELCLVSSRHDAWDSGQRVQSLFQPTRECYFSWSESPSAAIWQTPGVLFHLTSLPYRPDWWSASELVVLLEGPPVFTEQHWSSVVDHLPDPFYLSHSDVGRVLFVLNFFDLQMMEAFVVFGTFNAAQVFLYPFPLNLFLDTILSWRSTDNSLDFMSWVVLWYPLFAMGGHIDRYRPFQTMSNQLSF